MRIYDVSTLAGASAVYISSLRFRGQLPFHDNGYDVSPVGAFLVAVQRELGAFGSSVDEARDLVIAITDELRRRWVEICAEKQPLWLLVIHDEPKLVSSTQAAIMIAKNMSNGNAHSAIINLNKVLQEVCERAEMRHIHLPAISDHEEWWG